MKKIKCAISVVIGLILGLLSACVHQESDTTGKAGTNAPVTPTNKPPVTPATNKLPATATTNKPPVTQEGMPVRRPILE